MMKKAVLIIAFLSFGITIAQQSKVESSVLLKFQNAFNASNYDAIYKMFSKEKQNTFSLERTKAVFSRVHNTKGDILSITFINKQKEFNVYSVLYADAKGEIVVKLNNKGKADIFSTRNAQAVKQ